MTLYQFCACAMPLVSLSWQRTCAAWSQSFSCGLPLTSVRSCFCTAAAMGIIAERYSSVPELRNKYFNMRSTPNNAFGIF